jgi:hypothetical protein
MKAYWGNGSIAPLILWSRHQMEVSGQLHAPGTHWIGGWMGLRAVLDAVVKRKNSQPPPGIEPENPDRPARSPTLYRLTYHDSNRLINRNLNMFEFFVTSSTENVKFTHSMFDMSLSIHNIIQCPKISVNCNLWIEMHYTWSRCGKTEHIHWETELSSRSHRFNSAIPVYKSHTLCSELIASL